MSQKKLLTIFGATGAQGGGLARAILSDSNSEFSVRAVTRDPSSDKAKELAALGADMAKEMTKALGEEVRYNSISPETFSSFGFPGAEDHGNMFQYYKEFAKEFADARDIKIARELNPELQNFEMWLADNAKKIPLS